MNEPAADTRCPACGFSNLPGSRFCSQCGVRISAEEVEAERASRELDLPELSKTASGIGDRSNPEAEHIADPLIGAVIAGRYRIVEPLGRGGMGVVYKVEHARIGKLMALKLLTGELSRDDELVGRFKREALMVSKLSHPNTVQVFDYGTSEGMTYLAMEYLRGDDLGRIIRRGGPLTPERTAKIVVQVCSSLAEAHDLDIVHRDLKPENIFVLKGPSGSDLIKVLDFGLAKLRESSELGEVTSRGAIVGTPYYMAPEQIRGEAADQRSDIYALGALMHVCLTGKPVFDAPRPMGVLTKHLTEEPVSPCVRHPELGIPPRLGGIVLKALNKDPARRFQHVRELQQALVDELRGEGTPSVDLLLDSGQVQKLAGGADDLATRDEVERYERKLKRRGRFVWSALAVGMLAGAFVGWRLVARVGAISGFQGLELEPNNSASEATPVPFGEQVLGQLGQRLDDSTSDRDFYRIDVPAGVSTVALSTSALPNMAICTYLYRVGIEEPIGRYCSGQAGRDVKVDALELSPGNYLAAVMQDREDGVPVLENVSDSYRLTLSAVTSTLGREVEPNDSPRDANRVPPNSVFRGKLAWMRDVDAICVEGAGTVRFNVEDAPSSARPEHAVLQATPQGGAGDGIPVRVHRRGTEHRGSAERDAVSPWQSPPVEASSGGACLVLTLVPNPWAPTPHPRVAPASDQEYVVRVEKL